MPTLKIDGIEVAVEAGTNLIEAAFKAGKVVPHFCYHPKLSVAGNCRMCLVEIEGLRKPEIACNTQVRDGMVVKTESDKLKKLRQGVLEFLFLNHPLDCPVCDKAGECKLQDYYLEHGKYVSRLHEGKVRKPKRLDIGTHIILDTERCVLCSRCVRFCDEVSKTSELRILERGSHSTIGIHPDRRLDNRYSICTTDVCPVGALTSKDFRFQARVWYLERVQSICGGCANGCNIEAHHYRGEVKRFMPRRNDSVNDTWMCDDGRLSWHATQAVDRLNKAQVGAGREGTFQAGLDAALASLKGVVSGRGAGAVGFVLSPQATLEENFLLASLAKELGSALFLVTGNPVGSAKNDDDGFLIRADKNPNSAGARLVGSTFGAKNPGQLVAALESGAIKALVVLNNDVVGKAKEAGLNSTVFGKLESLVVLSTHKNASVEAASVALPLATYLETEGSWINAASRVQKFQRAVNSKGEARTGLELIPALAQGLGVAQEVRSAHRIFAALAEALSPLAGLTYEKLGEAGVSLSAASSQAA
ncbi:MAG: 2Fe-2S iron-sulfur cluster-binding protein [Myxococcota bacterium]